MTPHSATDRRVSKLGVVRRPGMDRRAERHSGYAVSQHVRKRIEEVFGWIKSSAGPRQTKHRGRERVGGDFDLAATTYNLVRLPKLLGQQTRDAIRHQRPTTTPRPVNPARPLSCCRFGGHAV